MGETGVFELKRVPGSHPFRVDAYEQGELVSIYECDRTAIPWIVKRLLRQGYTRKGEQP